MAKVFIGSSKEAVERGRVGEIARWLEGVGHEAIRWDDPGVFVAGKFVYQALIELSRTVQAAVFVFADDDQLWYREDHATQPRANVLIEYGLFSGVLGVDRAIFCRDGNPKTPTDLEGIISVNVPQRMKAAAREHFEAWAKTIHGDEQAEAGADTHITWLLRRYNDHVNWWVKGRPIQPNDSGEAFLETFGSAPVWAYMRPPSHLIRCTAKSNAYELMSEIEGRLLNFAEDSLPVAIALSDARRPVGIVTPSDLMKFDRWFHDRSASVDGIWFGPPNEVATCSLNQTCREAYRGMLVDREAPILTGLPVVDSRGQLVGFLPHHGGREDWQRAED